MSIVVKRTAWRDRLTLVMWWWPPMPYLFHRWDAIAEADEHLHLTGWCAGFWKRSSAQRYADFVNRP